MPAFRTRLWRRLPFLLLAGILTTLIIAWGTPLLPLPRAASVPDPHSWLDDSRAGQFQVEHRILDDQIHFAHLVFSGPPKDLPFYAAAAPPAWAFTLTHAMKGDPPADKQAWWSVDTFVTGWPCRAFRGAWYVPFPSSPPASSLTLVPDGKGGLTLQSVQPSPTTLSLGLFRFGRLRNDRFLVPLLPMARGLVIDTLVFGAFWGALWFTWARLRAWNRVRRHRCPRCNYNLVGLVPESTCPECGADSTRGRRNPTPLQT